jgi:ubiquinone/menaquinone biosynthesis C-methylase UbiE/uncharacterized protein YbaR (Trm112 family)
MTTATALDFLVAPGTHERLRLLASSETVPMLTSDNNARFPIFHGVPVFMDVLNELPETNLSSLNVAAAHFEQMYRDTGEPWSYSGRAAEVLRHEFVAAIALETCSDAARTLDLGCSVGQLSERLGKNFSQVVSLDVSPTAVLKAKQRCEARSTCDHYFVTASAADLPFQNSTFDLVIASDGLHGWELTREQQESVVREIDRVLRPSGKAVFTDYLRYEKFQQLIDLVTAGSLRMQRVEYLHDRLWYQMESLLRGVQQFGIVRAILQSRSIALVLRLVARLIGPRASKHICVIVEKVEK